MSRRERRRYKFDWQRVQDENAVREPDARLESADTKVPAREWTRICRRCKRDAKSDEVTRVPGIRGYVHKGSCPPLPWPDQICSILNKVYGARRGAYALSQDLAAQIYVWKTDPDPIDKRDLESGRYTLRDLIRNYIWLTFPGGATADKAADDVMTLLTEIEEAS